MRVQKILKAICLLVQLPLLANAQEHQDSTKTMDAVTVTTGQYKPQSLKNSVYQVRVITAEQIQRRSPARLQDIFNTELNIRFSQDLSTGGANINMLGLSGQNVKILIDGMPMVGRQGTSNEININQVDINSIERIEIVEGPMSVMYGADALAGVINIITKKTSIHGLGVTARLMEETVGKEYGIKQGIHNQYLGASASYKKWYVNGGVGRNLYNGWRDTATGRKLTWHKKDQIVGNATLGYRSERLNASYRFDGLDEIITNAGNFLPNSNEPAQDQEYITNRIMQQIQASYKAGDKFFIKGAASHTHFSRQVYSTLYYQNGDVRANTAPGSQSTSNFNGLTVRASVVYQPTKMIAIQPGVDINTEQGDGERMKSGKQHIEDYAFFITTEITPNSWLNIRPGVRFMKNSVYDAPPAIPSVNAKIVLAKRLDLRLAYARGFRAPSLRELYYDFFDASHSIMGNENLKAEQSASFTGALNGRIIDQDKIKLNSILNGFYNDVSNMIGFVSSPDNAAITTYMNISKFKSRGFTLVNELILEKATFSLGGGYTGRYNALSETVDAVNRYNWSPEISAAITKSLSEIGLTLNLNYKYTGTVPYYQSVANASTTSYQLQKTDGYHWADFSLNKNAGKMLMINAGIRNLFNVTTIGSTVASGGAHSSGGARPVGYGRSYFLGLVFNWNK